MKEKSEKEKHQNLAQNSPETINQKSISLPKFSKEQHREFTSTLNQRVNDHFAVNQLSKKGGGAMAFKSLVMVSLFVIPLVIISLGLLNSGWQLFVAYLICGLGMAGIGMGVMHDAIHGSYSNSPKLNRLMAQTMNLVGANASVWRVQHNVLHHTYTNIEGADDDLNTPTFLRFTPDRILKNVHRYQHWYTWFFYALSTISWITSKDFVRLKRYADKGLIKKGKEYNLLLTKLIAWKVAYYTYALILPVLFSGFEWGMVLLAFLSMHVVTGISISLVFQTAHIMPETNFPSPCPKGDMNCNWTVHQLETTTNYAPNSKLFSWFIGGLNYQVEHHLFPHICHLHYPRIAKIVKRTTEEFGLTYHSIPTFEGALKEHARMLKELGRQKKLQFASSEL